MTSTFTHRVGESVVLYAAPEAFGRLLLRGDVTAIALTVANLAAPDTALYSASYYTAAEPSTGDYTQAMFDSAQTGDEWPHTTGYTLAIFIDEDNYAFPEDGTFLVEAALTVAASGSWPDITAPQTRKVQWILDTRRIA